MEPAFFVQGWSASSAPFRKDVHGCRVARQFSASRRAVRWRARDFARQTPRQRKTFAMRLTEGATVVPQSGVVRTELAIDMRRGTS